MFVNTFIKRPILASVCSLIIILGGVIAIPTMPVAQFPPLAPPNITVTSIYTGANAQEVETAVTTALGRLPSEVRQLGVTVGKQSTGFVMAAGVYAEKGEYDSLFLSNYIDVYV